MTMAQTKIQEQLDSIDEFERIPVPERTQKDFFLLGDMTL